MNNVDAALKSSTLKVFLTALLTHFGGIAMSIAKECLKY
jgi:hypothetical protein